MGRGGASLGVDVELDGTMRPDALLFGESQSRIVLSLKESDWSRLQAIATLHRVPLRRLGRVGGTRFRLRLPTLRIDLSITEIEQAWKGGLASALGG